jgi:hypothetical protein
MQSICRVGAGSSFGRSFSGPTLFDTVLLGSVVYIVMFQYLVHTWCSQVLEQYDFCCSRDLAKVATIIQDEATFLLKLSI